MLAPAPPTASQPSLTARTITAARWRLISTVVQGAVQLGVGVLLARLLPPADFGVVALATVVVGLAALVGDLGMGPALVRQRPLTQRHVRCAFTVSLLIGLALAAAVFAGAAPAARLLQSRELAPVLRVESLLFAIGGAGVAARGLLQRGLRFRALFVVEFGSYAIGFAVVAVAMALAGYGVWSLVAGALVQRAIATLVALAATRHPLAPLLAGAELRALCGFGTLASLNQIVNYGARNGDNLIVGRWLGTQQLGLYSRAFNLMALPLLYVENVAWSVLFPALAEVADDPERLPRAYLLAVQTTTLAAAPAMACLGVVAPELIVGVYGERWRGAVLPLQLLCAAGAFRSLYNLGGAVAHATGALRAELIRQVGYAALVVAGSLIGARFGIQAVAAAVAVAVLYMYAAMAELAVRLTRCGWRAFIAAQVPGVFVAAIVWFAAAGMRTLCGAAVMGSVATLLMTASAAVVAWPVAVYLLPAHLRPLELFERLGRSLRRLPPPMGRAAVWAMRLPLGGDLPSR